jgi:hypothetical protein
MNFQGFGIRVSDFGKKRMAQRSLYDVAALQAKHASYTLGLAALPTRPRLALAILAVVMALGCSPKSDWKTPTLFPETNEAPGWSKGETRTFEASRLWEYIDGDADRYIQAGVLRTMTTDYRYQGKIEAVADIYVMKAPEGAKKIFDSESSVGSQPVQLGDSARLFPATLTFRKGSYFVRLVAYQEDPEMGKALTELARAIEQKLRG